MATKLYVTIAAAFKARYPNATAAEAGTVGSLAAAAGSVPSIEAGAVRGFAAVNGKLQWVKATDHFLVSGETVAAGDFVQLEEDDAKRVVATGRAELATAEQAAAEQSKPPAKGKA